MAIDVLLTGTVVSHAQEFMRKGMRHLKVTLEARDAKGDRVNVVCSSANARIVGSLELLERSQSACIRGHASVPLNAEPADGRRQPRIEVSVTDVIIL
ncbi:hypothetical protein [Ralstonia pseudosolanacearum]